MMPNCVPEERFFLSSRELNDPRIDTPLLFYSSIYGGRFLPIKMAGIKIKTLYPSTMFRTGLIQSDYFSNKNTEINNNGYC